MKSFKQFLSEDKKKEITVCYGHFNPPVAKHGELFDSLIESGNYQIYSTQITDKKYPLKYPEKIKFMRKMFPRHARNIIENASVNIIQVLSKLYREGYTKVKVVTPYGNSENLQTFLNVNNKRDLMEGFYNFQEKINVTGNEDLDVYSAALTEAAKNNDFSVFSENIPQSFAEATEMFNAIRLNLGLKEAKNFSKKHIKLETTGTRREDYVSGSIFAVNNEVIIKESNEVAKITFCGSNYLIVEKSDGTKVRKWLDAVELVEVKEEEFKSEFKEIKIEPKATIIPKKTLSKIRAL